MPDRTQHSATLAARRVLVVDPDVLSAKLIQAVLEPEGCQVRLASDAKAALIAVLELRPELVLLELNLPGLSGLDLVRLLKADTSTSPTTIVAVTASNGPETMRLAMQAGCADYIRKPIDPLGLASRLTSLLGKSPGSSKAAGKRGIDA